MSDEQERHTRPQLHIDRLRREAETRKVGPDGKCAGTSVGDLIKLAGNGEIVSFVARTGRDAGTAAGQKTRLLLIEPDEKLRTYLQKILYSHGFDVTVADHPDGRAMYQQGVQTEADSEFPAFNVIVWGYPDAALKSGDILISAPDPVSAMRFNNNQGIPTVMITDVAGVKNGFEDRKRNGLIAHPVMVLDRENMDLTSQDGLRDAAVAIESAARAAIAKERGLKNLSTGKER